MRRVLWFCSIVAVGMGILTPGAAARAEESTWRFLMEEDALVSTGRNPSFILAPGDRAFEEPLRGRRFPRPPRPRGSLW